MTKEEGHSVPKIFIEILDNGTLPQRASEQAAGYDLAAAAPCRIMPGMTGLVPTGLKIALPLGYEAQIRPRSGLSLRTSVRIPNSPGTIDADYRDEIKVIIYNSFHFTDLPELILQKPELVEYLQNKCRKVNFSNFLTATSGLNIGSGLIGEREIWLEEDGLPFGTIRIEAGDRIAQMIIARSYAATFEICDNVSKLGSDRGGGFGSTGNN